MKKKTKLKKKFKKKVINFSIYQKNLKSSNKTLKKMVIIR